VRAEALVGKFNDEENAKEKLYTYASHVPVVSFKVRSPTRPFNHSHTPLTVYSPLQGLQTVVVDTE
jgi:hypothetical protein